MKRVALLFAAFFSLGAIDLDGTDDWLNLGTDLSHLNAKPGATLMTWVNPDALTASPLVSLSIGPPTGSPTATSRAALEMTAAGAITCLGRSADTEGVQSLASASGQIVVGAWTHLACVLNIGGDQNQIYVNGSLVATGTVAYSLATFATTNSRNGAIGRQDNGTGTPFNGRLTDARIYDRVLSAAEILTIYHSRGADSIVTGLMSRWTFFDGAPGTAAGTITDLARLRNLTATNGPIFFAGPLMLDTGEY